MGCEKVVSTALDVVTAGPVNVVRALAVSWLVPAGVEEVGTIVALDTSTGVETEDATTALESSVAIEEKVGMIVAEDNSISLEEIGDAPTGSMVALDTSELELSLVG